MIVHGPQCISYPGNCLVSSYLTGNSANLGNCTKYCKRKKKRTKPDICLVERIPEIIDIGIHSVILDISEKSSASIYTITKTYRF